MKFLNTIKISHTSKKCTKRSSGKCRETNNGWKKLHWMMISGGTSPEKSERSGGGVDVIPQPRGIPN